MDLLEFINDCTKSKKDNTPPILRKLKSKVEYLKKLTTGKITKLSQYYNQFSNNVTDIVRIFHRFSQQANELTKSRIRTVSLP